MLSIEGCAVFRPELHFRKLSASARKPSPAARRDALFLNLIEETSAAFPTVAIADRRRGGSFKRGSPRKAGAIAEGGAASDRHRHLSRSG